MLLPTMLSKYFCEKFNIVSCIQIISLCCAQNMHVQKYLNILFMWHTIGLCVLYYDTNVDKEMLS